jgi:hypothetical protein
MSMCPTHRAEWMAWLDFKAARPIAIGYVDNSKYAAMRRQSDSAKQTYDTIRYQQDLIQAACDKECNLDDPK